MRNMSFFLTANQVRNRTKTVTRRLGWKTAKAGDIVQPVVKGQGIPKGCKAEKIGGPIRFVRVHREFLDRMDDNEVGGYGDTEARLEGFPEMSGTEFVAMFCDHNGNQPGDWVTRIEFEYLPEDGKDD